MLRISNIKVIFIRFSALFLAVAITLLFTSCQLLKMIRPDQEYKPILMLPSGYIPPLQADWSSVFLAPQLPAKTASEKALNVAWNQQLDYIRTKMLTINEQGHLLYSDLLKTAEMLIEHHEDAASPIIQSIEAYTVILLQTDTIANIVQSDELATSSEQAVMEYNLLLASVKLATQSTRTLNELLSWVLDDNNNLNEKEFLKFEANFSNVLAKQRPLMQSSRELVEAHARLQLVDHVIGGLLEGANLAKLEVIERQSEKLSSEGHLNKKTSDAILQQLLYSQSGYSADNDSETYLTRAKGFVQLFDVVNDIVEAPVNMVNSLVDRVHEPVNEKLRELCEAIDDSSGNRISAAGEFMIDHIHNMAEALGLTEEQSVDVLQAAVLAGSELSISENRFEQIQLISDNTFAELEYLDREDENVSNAIAAYGYQLLTQLTGYMETFADDSLRWLDSTMEAAADLLALPPEEETAHLREEINQLSALLFGEARSDPETQYLCDLLGFDFLSLEQELHATGEAWLHELDTLAEQFADFLGPDIVNVLINLDHLLLLPLDLVEYPINRLCEVGSETNRYAEIQGNRMTLSILESIHDLYIALGIRDNIKLDGLTDELDQALNGYLNLDESRDNIAELTDEQLEQALLAWLDQLNSLNDLQIRQILLEQLQFLIDLYQDGGNKPSAADTSQPDETEVPGEPSTSDFPPVTSITPSDASADVWLGHWAGSMRIHQIAMPEVYSDEEQEALLKTEIPIEFTISHDSSGGYTISISNLQGNLPLLEIDHRQMRMSFSESAPDGAVIYQILDGDLLTDDNQIVGEFVVGIADVGDIYSGSWLVIRQS